MSNRNKRETKQLPNPDPSGASTTPTMDVSAATLDLLETGRAELLQRRQQLTQQLAELDAAIQRQVGGIQLMQTLLGRDGAG